MKTSIDLRFADGSYTFAIGLAQALEIERKCGPIGEVTARLLKGTMPTLSGEWLHNPMEAAYGILDMRMVVWQGLIGGAKGYVDREEIAVSSVRATDLIERYFDDAPLMERWKLARAIVYALCEGYDPPEKKKEAAPAVTSPKRRRPRKTATSHA